MKRVFALLAVLVLAGCSAAQNVASKDAEWDGACLNKSIFGECFSAAGPEQRECIKGHTFTREQASERVRLADKRLERLGMDCEGWQP